MFGVHPFLANLAFRAWSSGKKAISRWGRVDGKHVYRRVVYIRSERIEANHQPGWRASFVFDFWWKLSELWHTHTHCQKKVVGFSCHAWGNSGRPRNHLEWLFWELLNKVGETQLKNVGGNCLNLSGKFCSVCIEQFKQFGFYCCKKLILWLWWKIKLLIQATVSVNLNT